MKEIKWNNLLIYLLFIFFRWLKLLDKPGKEKKKERGELEVKISFIVKSGSLSNLSKKEKHKSSLGQLSQAAHSFGMLCVYILSM